MIKKAVLPLLSAPFLILFSDYSEARWAAVSNASDPGGLRNAFIANSCHIHNVCHITDPDGDPWTINYYLKRWRDAPISDIPPEDFIEFDISNVIYTDEQCDQKFSGESVPVSASSANYLTSGGSAFTGGGACSVSGAGGVMACTGEPVECVLDLQATSTGETYDFDVVNADLKAGGEGTFSVMDFSVPSYLNELPGGCTDSSSCVEIVDTSYLVDWDSAPDYFEYVDSSGTTHSKSSSGGGGDDGDPTDPTDPGSGGDDGDPTDPTDPGGDNGDGDDSGDPTDPTDPGSGGDDGDPTDPTDPGGDNGDGDDSGNDDSDGSNDGGGGSTVPDFEFDESGIIEAIGSAGRSNRNAINALSNDVTGAISDQTNDLNTATTAQTDALNNTLNNQTDSLTDSLDGQTDGLTSALEDQTGTITNSLDALGNTFTDALKGLGLGSVGDGSGEGEGEDGEGDGLLGGISTLLNGMVDKLASSFTEDLGNGDDLFDSSGMDETLDGVALQEQEHGDEINSLMDEIGDGASSDIAEQITSRLPSLPSGGCVPLQFGPMEISCQSFNTIKLWLTWIIYFWTVVSIVDTFFRSEQRTA